jgi:biotin carboxylase
MPKQYTFLCISSYFKGEAFLEACKKAGNKVYLITSSKLACEAWPWEALEDVYYMQEDENNNWNMEHLINAVAYRMRSVHFDRFVALDDFDVEKVSRLREQFRVPGMGDTTSRYFRDKLAMRVKAKMEGVPVPPFTPLFNDAEIETYIHEVAPPWMVKPRSEASAVGIKKINDSDTLWKVLNELGDNRHRYLLEKFSPGTVYHVDSLTYEGKVVFTRVSRYLDAPFDVAHGGGIFRSHTCDFNDPAAKKLKTLNAKVLKAFGMQYSASHTEFIESRDTGEFLFLETSSRVGGAHLAEMVEYASGVNLWAEWARLETAVVSGKPYKIPTDKLQHAGIVVSLSRDEHPDSSQFKDKEIVWRLKKLWHIGLIVRHKKTERVLELLHNFTERIRHDYHATAPVPNKSH